MSFVMTPVEREAFLADVHVGVLAVERDGRAPLAVPIWYDYRDGEVLLWMERGSVKFRTISAAGRFSFTVQSEVAPYRYVTAEGPVVGADPPTSAQVRAITARYVPADAVDGFVGDAPHDGAVLVRMRPQRWLSNDQSKQ